MRKLGLFFLFSFLLTACSTTGPIRDTDRGSQDTIEPAPEQPIDYAAFEDFDPTPYADEPLGESVLQHDVPAELMENRAAASVARTGRGYRIQITQTQDKSAADAMLAEAVAWWREQAAKSDSPSFFDQGESPVYILYRQPYYRVRLGNFVSQADALSALSHVSARFPGAAVVPDTVTLPR